MLAKTIVLAMAAFGAAALAGAGEPSRSVLLENERVRVVEVAFEPGDVEPVHTHATDLLVVAVTPGGIESTAPDGAAQRLVPKAGDVHFYAKGSTHTARNTGQARVILRAVFLK